MRKKGYQLPKNSVNYVNAIKVAFAVLVLIVGFAVIYKASTTSTDIRSRATFYNPPPPRRSTPTPTRKIIPSPTKKPTPTPTPIKISTPSPTKRPIPSPTWF